MTYAICAIISLGDASPHRSMQPTRSWPLPRLEVVRMETSSLPSSTDEIAPAWPCSRRGLPGRTHCCTRRWSLTPPFHHHELFPCGKNWLFVSVALFRQIDTFRHFPPRMLSDAVLYRSADFPRFRQRRTAIAQPTWGKKIIHAEFSRVNIISDNL